MWRARHMSLGPIDRLLILERFLRDRSHIDRRVGLGADRHDRRDLGVRPARRSDCRHASSISTKPNAAVAKVGGGRKASVENSLLRSSPRQMSAYSRFQKKFSSREGRRHRLDFSRLARRKVSTARKRSIWKFGRECMSPSGRSARAAFRSQVSRRRGWLSKASSPEAGGAIRRNGRVPLSKACNRNDAKRS